MSTEPSSPEERTAADRRVDVRAILVIFVALILGAIHFISGWTPQL